MGWRSGRRLPSFNDVAALRAARRCSGSAALATAARATAAVGVAAANAAANCERPTADTSGVSRGDWITATVNGPTVAVVAPTET
jgi:hypothetical protein